MHSRPARVASRAFAPGRVNLIGEHTDYNDGLCLPFAIERGVTVDVTDRPGDLVRVRARDLDEEDVFRLSATETGAGWRAFARGTIAELQRTGRVLRGADIEIRGDVPRGAGLSSSAALAVAMVLALLAHGEHSEPERLELARLCSRVERRWLGAQTGLLDQMASLYGVAGHALRLDMRDLAVEPVALELTGWRLVVLDSGDRRENATSGYNARRRECRAACDGLGVASLRDAEPAAAAELPSPLDRRVRHVLEENERVEAAVAALHARDLPGLGRLLDASHASLRDLYETSTPRVEQTVQALRAGGAEGARMVGGGFGGAVLALLPPGARPPEDALEVRPGPAARLLASGSR